MLHALDFDWSSVAGVNFMGEFVVFAMLAPPPQLFHNTHALVKGCVSVWFGIVLSNFSLFSLLVFLCILCVGGSFDKNRYER